MVKKVMALVINGLLIYVIARVFPNVAFHSYWDSILLVLVLAILNFLVKPVLKLLTLPITIITLGLFSLVINMFILWLGTVILPGVTITGLGSFFLFSIVLSFVTTVVNKVLD